MEQQNTVQNRFHCVVHRKKATRNKIGEGRHRITWKNEAKKNDEKPYNLIKIVFISQSNHIPMTKRR